MVCLLMVRLGQVGHVDHGRHVNRKLQQDRQEYVEVEDAWQRSLAGQSLDGLSTGTPSALLLQWNSDSERY